MKIEGVNVLITGGASGLGEATARLLVKRGATVTIADMAASGEAIAADIGARYVKCDVSNLDDMAAAVEAARGNGRLDVTVNCAGISFGEKIIGKNGPHDAEKFSRAMNVNLVGTFNSLNLSANAMAKQEAHDTGERGLIINTASVAAFDGQIGQVAYAASKGAIVALALPAARELARYGIRVMTIAPGLFETAMMLGLPTEVQQALGQSIPFPSRLGRPSEFAALVCHIINNEMLNGECIRLDGALRMASK